ncbi:MAG: K+/H+ antiporter subunit F [Myxococcota bacterium]
MLTKVSWIVLVVLIVSMVLSLFRLFRGPSYPDRILALDTLFVNTVGMLLLLGIVLDTSVYFESVLLISMMGFVGTCAFAKYLLRGDIME